VRHHQARQSLRRRARREPDDAYTKALVCDPVSAFGGIVALNRTLDAATAAEDRQGLHRSDHRAGRRRRSRRAIIAAKKNLRLLLTGGLPDPRRRASP
jgi:phosphoribosylaminoimidazolecarboxamide formyltransferase/IMP cyclohydrolase